MRKLFYNALTGIVTYDFVRIGRITKYRGAYNVVVLDKKFKVASFQQALSLFAEMSYRGVAPSPLVQNRTLHKRTCKKRWAYY